MIGPFLLLCMYAGYVYEVGTQSHYAMPVKAVELVLSHLHMGSGAQTQQHLYLQAISPAWLSSFCIYIFLVNVYDNLVNL